MTLNEAKAVIYGNVVYACEKAGLAPQTTRLVQDACDTIIAKADACETIVALVDRKTENSSEKPNNCEECKHWNDTEDGCADRHGCRTTTEGCSTVPTSSILEQVDEPQKCSVNGRPYDCGNCEYHKCTADEPQK